MASSRVPALGTQTGAALAANDLLTNVDVSDTSMAASGTNKKMTVQEFAKGLATLSLAPYTWYYDAGSGAHTNVAAETSIFSALKTFPTMAVGDALRVVHVFNWNNTSAGNQTMTIRMYNGTNRNVDTAGTSAATGTSHQCMLDITMICIAVGGGIGGSVSLNGELAVGTSSTPILTSLLSAGTNMIGGGAATWQTDGLAGNGVFDIRLVPNTSTNVVTNGPVICTYIPKVV